jgi:phage virion morphogenesis family|nr:MAG TPA: tail morphogenesis protein [Caudoviricetes sp.]
MDIKDYVELIKSQRKEIDQLMRRQLPVKIGRMAKDHFQENFRKGGFVNNGLQQWPKTKRQLSGTSSAAAQYGPLLSGRNHLFSSMKYTPSDYRVKVANEVPYAAIHNEGGTVNPTVTPEMRRFAWAMFYKSSGKKKGKRGSMLSNPDAERWKALALTKKSKLTVKIPKRQFLGESAELRKSINDKIEKELSKILGI